MTYFRANKYNAQRVNLWGYSFRSKRERDHALWLESEKRAKRISEWQYEKAYLFSVAGKTIGSHKPDFTVTYPDGRVEVHEIKGGNATKTDGWYLRRNLFEALYPAIEYKVFDGRPQFKIITDEI